MKAYRLVFGFCCLIGLVPLTGQAEIYKWVENGTVRYSDTPPPSNIKSEKIIKKKETKKDEAAAKDALATSINKNVPPANAANKKIATPDDVDKDMQAARARQQQAENDKNKKQEQEEQAKIKEQNCISAKASYETYKQGGRISKVDENGEKSYLGDNDIKAGLGKAQADIDQYCN